MLFEPFEEQFDLPAAVVELGNRQCRFGEVVGQKDQRTARLGIAIANAPQAIGIIAPSIKLRENDGLIQTQTGVLVHGTRITASCPEAAASAGDKKGAALMQAPQSGKIQITRSEERRVGKEGRTRW